MGCYSNNISSLIRKIDAVNQDQQSKLSNQSLELKKA